MSEQKTIYAGGGKQVKGQYGTFRAITVNLSDLPKEHIFEYNGKKYIKLNVSDKQEPDNYGKDVSVSINTWKPDTEQPKNKSNQRELKNEPTTILDEVDGDLPF